MHFKTRQFRRRLLSLRAHRESDPWRVGPEERHPQYLLLMHLVVIRFPLFVSMIFSASKAYLDHLKGGT